nr:hypothetical protein [Thauera sp.]
IAECITRFGVAGEVVVDEHSARLMGHGPLAEVPLGDLLERWAELSQEDRSRRCLDTARLAFAPELEIQPWPALNSFFGDRGREPKQRAEVLAALAPRMEANRVWVTHQVNITSLTGVFPAMGEIVVIRPGAQGLEVVGRFVPG